MKGVLSFFLEAKKTKAEGGRESERGRGSAVEADGGVKDLELQLLRVLRLVL